MLQLFDRTATATKKFGVFYKKTSTLEEIFSAFGSYNSRYCCIFETGVRSSLYQDSSGTTPVTAVGQPVGKIVNRLTNTLNFTRFSATQSTADHRPIYSDDGSENRCIVFDGVDDELDITAPVGGFIGTLILCWQNGATAYEVSIPEGTFSIGGPNIPDTKLFGIILIDTTISSTTINTLLSEIVTRGSGTQSDWSTTTDFTNAWKDQYITVWDSTVDTSNATDLTSTWEGNKFVSFPSLSLNSVTTFNSTWKDCTELVTFPSGFFDSWSATPASDCFTDTWSGCSSLSAESVENIYVSLDASGVNPPASNKSITVDYDINTGDTTDTTNTAIISLITKGWIVNLNGSNSSEIDTIQDSSGDSLQDTSSNDLEAITW
jgi:hypothetical protein